MKVLFFGCWNHPGHFIFAPGGEHARHGNSVEWYRPGVHLGGNLAPRLRKDYYGGGLCWAGQGETSERRQRIAYESNECPQGQFLRHVLPNGFTAIQWWDRQQGDSRGACNSTVLVEGERTSEEMLSALAEHFPHVLANLKRGGVELVEVFASQDGGSRG